jgi:hypothetical protein
VADRPPGDEPPPDEPRAGDVARAKSTAELEDKLDPATIAQLAAWFDLPSFEELEERRQAEEPEIDERAERRKEVHARITEVADQTILARMQHWTGAGDTLIHLPPPMEVKIGGEIRVADSDWSERMGTIADEREVEIPSWIEEAFHEATPQAILRDLHRPEDDFALRFQYLDTPPTLSDMRKELHSEIGRSLQVRPDTPPSWQTIRDATAELRRWKAANWAELPLPKREASE